jgi:hypothetical protein
MKRDKAMQTRNALSRGDMSPGAGHRSNNSYVPWDVPGHVPGDIGGQSLAVSQQHHQGVGQANVAVLTPLTLTPAATPTQETTP